MNNEEIVRHAITGEKPNPVVVAVINGQEFDIGYACEFDHETQKITLPSNLPGGSEVYADGVHIHTTPVALADKATHVPRSQRPLKRNLLSACIGAILSRPEGYHVEA